MLGSELELVVIFQGITGNLYCVLACVVMCVRVCFWMTSRETHLPLPPPAAAAVWEKDAGWLTEEIRSVKRWGVLKVNSWKHTNQTDESCERSQGWNSSFILTALGDFLCFCAVKARKQDHLLFYCHIKHITLSHHEQKTNNRSSSHLSNYPRISVKS